MDVTSSSNIIIVNKILSVMPSASPSNREHVRISLLVTEELIYGSPYDAHHV